MSLNQHANNEKAFVWSTVCDFSDGEARPETFCIRFGSIETAQKFKKAFDEAKEAAASIKNLYDSLKTMALNEESSGESDESDDEADDQKEESPDTKIEPKIATPAEKSADNEQGTDGKENEAPEVTTTRNSQ
jgi:Ran-binding protein 1